MKTLWTILAALAVANIIAIGALFAWLKATDRLSPDRLQHVKEVFLPTLAEQQAALDAQAAAALQKQADQAQAEKMAQPPTTAAERIADQKLAEEQRLQVTLRRQQELESLRQSLLAQLASLEDRERTLAAERAAFKAERERIASTEGAQQFKTALVTLEGQRPRDAMLVLSALLTQGQTDQVVSYLAKMEEAKRSKVIAEFVKTDPAVAADLLERLRTRGITPPEPSTQTASNDASPLQPAE